MDKPLDIKKIVLIEKKYGGILVSLTVQAQDRANIIIQTNYLIPGYKHDGSLINDDISDILVGRNVFLISLEKDISQYLRVLGEDIKIEFSKLKRAEKIDIDNLKNIIIEYKEQAENKKIKFHDDLENLQKTADGDIYTFDRIVDRLRKNGFILNNDKLSELRIKCYSQHIQ
jgi:hypothetical protein